jgi:hypothetical protein
MQEFLTSGNSDMPNPDSLGSPDTRPPQRTVLLSGSLLRSSNTWNCPRRNLPAPPMRSDPSWPTRVSSESRPSKSSQRISTVYPSLDDFCSMNQVLLSQRLGSCLPTYDASFRLPIEASLHLSFIEFEGLLLLNLFSTSQVLLRTSCVHSLRQIFNNV